MDISHLDSLPRRQRLRREIIIEFHKMRADHPHYKKSFLAREVAKKLGYSIDQNRSNSHIMTVIRQWETRQA